MTHFRGEALTWELSEQLFIGWLGNQVNERRFPSNIVLRNSFRVSQQIGLGFFRRFFCLSV